MGVHMWGFMCGVNLAGTSSPFVSPSSSYSKFVVITFTLWSQSVSIQIDHLRNRLNFDLNKSRQKFHHSLKEHHKISNIPKFRCEML